MYPLTPWVKKLLVANIVAFIVTRALPPLYENMALFPPQVFQRAAVPRQRVPRLAGEPSEVVVKVEAVGAAAVPEPEVVRAVAHRDGQQLAELLVSQFPRRLHPSRLRPPSRPGRARPSCLV